MATNEHGLTPKQEAFCLAYVECNVGTDAYRRTYNTSAGKMRDQTVCNNASRLLNDPLVKARISALRAAVTEAATKQLSIDKTWVLTQLVENVAMAKQAEPVLDREGKPTGEYTQNLAAANRALEMIGKELGMFVDRKEVRTGALDDASVEELLEIRKALEAKKGNAVH